MRDPSPVASKADIRQQAIKGGEVPIATIASKENRSRAVDDGSGQPSLSIQFPRMLNELQSGQHSQF
jgi:hypothetical protein